jgi:hypothetical protein
LDRTFQDENQALKTAFDRFMTQMRIAIPARVESFDPETQLATCVPAIRKVITKEGEKEFINLPPVIEVPMIYPHAQTAGFALTLPIQKGDSVLLVIADRSIDRWVEFGNIQDPVEDVEVRHNDITDSLAIIGATPMPQALPSYQTNAIEIRNRARDTRITLDNDTVEITNASGAQIKLNADGSIDINSPTALNFAAPTINWIANAINSSRYSGSGDIIASMAGMLLTVKDLITGAVSSYNNHTHPGDSGGTTGTPNP